LRGPNEACGRVIVVRTTPDVARRRAHVPPPRPKPPRPETSPAAAPTPPFTPTRIRGEEGKREASVPSRPASATSCFSPETARPQGGVSRPTGRQHRRHHPDDATPAQHQGVRAAPRAAHRANQADTDDKEGLGGWRRRAPVGRHAQGEGRAVGSPPDRPCHQRGSDGDILENNTPPRNVPTRPRQCPSNRSFYLLCRGLSTVVCVSVVCFGGCRCRCRCCCCRRGWFVPSTFPKPLIDPQPTTRSSTVM
jgi:hypothetical protein